MRFYVRSALQNHLPPGIATMPGALVLELMNEVPVSSLNGVIHALRTAPGKAFKKIPKKHLPESVRSPIFALRFRAENDPVAQLVEQYTFNVWVLGSSPNGITKAFAVKLQRLFSFFSPVLLPAPDSPHRSRRSSA
jgi:hypothetical protein